MEIERKATSPYKDSPAWQKAMELVEQVYQITNQLPQHELYGITAQIRRSAVSIPSNIAEGSRRGTKKEYAHFLKIAIASSAELETPLILIQRIYRVSNTEPAIAQLIEIQKMLSVYARKIHP